MSTTSTVNSVYSSIVNSSTTNREVSSELGKDDFLNLLVTQLQYQDPMNPMEDQDFIAQMAQFSALEQMQNMSSAMENVQAFSMIGKEVTAYVQGDDGLYEEVKGEVESIKIDSGKIYVVVGEKEIALSDITNVSSIAETEDEENEFQALAGYTDLIGRNVSVMFIDADGENYIEYDGTVSRLESISGKAYISVDNVNVNATEAVMTEEEANNYSSLLDYLEGNVGNEVTLIVNEKKVSKVPYEDEETGEITYKEEVVENEVTMTGTLREYEVNEDGELVNTILDGIIVPANNVVTIK
jgi:flagellar basal-body rod modification protein FlgD